MRKVASGQSVRYLSIDWPPTPVAQFAKLCHDPVQSAFARLLNGKSSVSPEMALRLSKTLGRTPGSWLAMQSNYDLWQTLQRINLDEVEALEVAVE